MRIFLSLLTLCALNLFCQDNSPHPGVTSEANSNDYPEQRPAYFTELRPDSILLFPFDQSKNFYGNGYLFSPFDKNSIWVTPESSEGFEFNLVSGQKTPFSEKFGHAFFKKPIRADGIRLDAFEQQVCWFLNFHGGVFRFDQSSGEGHFFDIAANQRAITAILFTPKYVWIGTSDGLWMFERNTGLCRPADRSPRVWIAQLLKGSGEKVLAGNQHAYDPETNCWEVLETLNGIPVDAIENRFDAGGYCLIARNDDNRLFIIDPAGKATATPDFRWTNVPGKYTHGWPYKNFLHHARLSTTPPFVWSADHNDLRLLDLRSGNIRFYDLQLPPSGTGYRQAEGTDDFWFFDKTYWIAFQKIDGKATIFHSPVADPVISILSDSRNLYVLTPGAFVVIDREYLAKRYRGDDALPEKIARLNHLCDSLGLNNSENWPNRRDKIAWLKAQFPNESDPYIQSRIQSYLFNFYQGAGEEYLRALLLEKDIDPEVASGIYSQLFESLAQAGRLREAAQTGKEFTEKNLPAGKAALMEEIDRLTATMRQIDSLDQTQIPGYEKQWAKAQIITEWCIQSGYFTNEASCYNLLLPDSIYRELIRQYPKSPRADDAAYQRIINSQCFEGEDGSHHPEVVSTWKKFLKQYPASEWRAHVLCHIAWALGRTLPELREGLRLLAEAERLRPELFSKSNREGYLWEKDEFRKQLDWYEIDFSIQAEKTTVRREKAVVLDFSLKNTAQEVKILNMIAGANYPNFWVEVIFETPDIKCVKPVVFVESDPKTFSLDASAWQEIKLEPGETYRERWDLTQMAVRYRTTLPGRYVFDQPGTYLIRAFCRNFDREKTAELRLTVE